MRDSGTKRAISGTLNKKLFTKVRDRIEIRFRPGADLLLNHLGQRIAPTVARLHKWCQTKTSNGGGRKQKRKKGTDSKTQES